MTHPFATQMYYPLSRQGNLCSAMFWVYQHIKKGAEGIFFLKNELSEIRSNSPLFLSLSSRFLHIAVAQGRRALSYVLARKMNALHMLDVKEHNGQVRTRQSGVAKMWSLWREWQPASYSSTDSFRAQDQTSLVNINFERLTVCYHHPWSY